VKRLARVGSGVGSRVGASVRDRVGSRVEARAWDRVGNRVGARVGDFRIPGHTEVKNRLVPLTGQGSG